LQWKKLTDYGYGWTGRLAMGFNGIACGKAEEKKDELPHRKKDRK
jgi:hypothetical protein